MMAQPPEDRFELQSSGYAQSITGTVTASGRDECKGRSSNSVVLKQVRGIQMVMFQLTSFEQSHRERGPIF